MLSTGKRWMWSLKLSRLLVVVIMPLKRPGYHLLSINLYMHYAHYFIRYRPCRKIEHQFRYVDGYFLRASDWYHAVSRCSRNILVGKNVRAWPIRPYVENRPAYAN